MMAFFKFFHNCQRLVAWTSILSILNPQLLPTLVRLEYGQNKPNEYINVLTESDLHSTETDQSSNLPIFETADTLLPHTFPLIM